MGNSTAPEIKHDFAQIGDVRLHYATAGSGEKLVVLLHGFPEFWFSWRHQIGALSEKYTVVAPDMRGYNLSSKPRSVKEYEINKLVDDVTGLIRHFGREQAALVGHDWGAAVAWAVAATQPAYVWKLAALQVPPPAAWRKNQTVRQFLASWYMFFFQLPALPEWVFSASDFYLLEKTLRGMATRRGGFSDEEINQYKNAWSEPGALTGAINYYRANLVRLFLRRQKTEENKNAKRMISVPTLFIYGERDAAVLPETVKNVQLFVDAPYRELRLPKNGHWVQQEAVEEVNAALLEFLDE